MNQIHLESNSSNLPLAAIGSMLSPFMEVAGMTLSHYDLLIIGGGLAGATLARSMAMAGHRTLIIEKELKFRDRIRGEVLLPWGSVEARELGIYDLLLASCAREALRERFFYAGQPSAPRDYRSTTPRSTCVLSFHHPDMQEELLADAQRCGVDVWRGAALSRLTPGSIVSAEIAVDGEVRSVTARLVVGADGRESQLATLLNLKRERDPEELMTGGLQLTGDLDIEHALYFFLHAISGRGAILIRTKPGNFRAYLLHHKDALPRRLSGERDFPAVMGQFREIGLPGEWLERLTPYGIFSTFDGAHRWITHPVRHGCVLIGDAAAASDPVWGNGLSRTLRDVRLLRDHLLANPDWQQAIHHYAEDHDDFFHRLRRAEKLNAALYFAIGDAAERRRERANALMAENPELDPDVSALGPEARCDASSIATLLGEAGQQIAWASPKTLNQRPVRQFDSH
jgi:2-polyprenyl-6-methoxyphenol hydroxylase-like FAD-dependent oxidoreductase